MTFSKPSFAEFYFIAGNTNMLPAHIWKHVNPSHYLDKNPVGTGPYELSSFSPEELTLRRNPRYWQPGRPKVTERRFPTYSSNTTASLYLQQGKLGWGAFFEPNLKRTYVAKSRAYHIWMPYTSIYWIIPNVKVSPLNSVTVRRAISFAVDRKQVATDGEGGYAPADTSPTGLVLPNDASYLDPSYAHDALTQNLHKARQLFEKAGFRPGRNGILTKAGRPLSLTMIVPSPFTNFVTDGQIIAGDLRKVGMDVKVNTISEQAWMSDLQDGHFQLAEYWSEGDPDPYSNYDGWLDANLSAPIGKPAAQDLGRVDIPRAQRLLAEYRSATTNAARKRSIQGLEGVMVKDLPVIPLVYSPHYSEYQTNQVTGWPSAANPYDPATPNAPWDEVVALHLKPVR